MVCHRCCCVVVDFWQVVSLANLLWDEAWQGLLTPHWSFIYVNVVIFMLHMSLSLIYFAHFLCSWALLLCLCAHLFICSCPRSLTSKISKVLLYVHIATFMTLTVLYVRVDRSCTKLRSLMILTSTILSRIMVYSYKTP